MRIILILIIIYNEVVSLVKPCVVSNNYIHRIATACVITQSNKSGYYGSKGGVTRQLQRSYGAYNTCVRSTSRNDKG